MRSRIPLLVLLIATSLTGIGFAQKAATPKPADKAVIAEPSVKELLLLMDSNQHGKVSKHDWMKFMEDQFDRLDKKKKGELDTRELRQSIVPAKYISSASLGK